jgi:hypothetical protein
MKQEIASPLASRIPVQFFILGLESLVPAELTFGAMKPTNFVLE